MAYAKRLKSKDEPYLMAMRAANVNVFYIFIHCACDRSVAVCVCAREYVSVCMGMSVYACAIVS